MPKPKLKSLRDQVIVITGATSGIGLSTARMAAERGASLMLVARNEDALRTLAGELRGRGARAEYQAADVADVAALERVSERTLEAFGRFDSWVNNAGGSLYGTLEDTPLADQRRSFDVVYWGVVNGTLVASRHLRTTAGGAIVNVGSVLSDRAISMQGTYSSAKHAVKGITDAFRMEFEGAGYPIAVTLIKPSSIDTLFPEHARNLTGEPGTRLPPPTYHPRVVGRAILHACEYGPRTLVVGMGGYAIALLGNHFPRLTDYIMEATSKSAQTTAQPGQADRRDNLYEPRADLSETGSLDQGPAPRRTSLLLEAQMNPLGTTGILVGLGAVVVGAYFGMRSNRAERARAAARDARRRAGWFAGRAEREAGRLSGGSLRRLAALGGEARSRTDDASDTARGWAGDARARGERLVRDARDTVGSYAEDAAGTASSLAEGARRKGWQLWSGARDAAGSYAGDASEDGGRAPRRARKRGWRLWREARDGGAGLAAEARDTAGSYADDVIERGERFLRRVRGEAPSRGRRWWNEAREGASHLAEDARDNGEWLLREARRKARRWF